MSGLHLLLMVIGYFVIGVIIQGIYDTIENNGRDDNALNFPLFFIWGMFAFGFIIGAPFYYLYKGITKFTKWVISKKETKQLTQNHKRVMVEDKELEEAYAEVEQELNSEKPFKQFTK